MTTAFQNVPYLPRQRNFPNDNAQALGVELDKAYIDIAQRVNERTIGVYAANKPVITGNTWYINGEPRLRQTLRQIFPFTNALLTFPHGINLTQIGGFVNIYGTFTDGTNWYPLPYVDTTAANNQINLKVTPTNIVITLGGGGGQPALTSGFVVLEWLSTIATNS